MSEGIVASLFIDGAWVPSGDGTCSPVVNPSDGSSSPRSTSRPTSRSRPPSRRLAERSTMANGHARRLPIAPRSWIASRTCSSDPRSSHARRRATPARPCARAASMSPTSSASSSTPTSPTRTRADRWTRASRRRCRIVYEPVGGSRADRAVELPAPAAVMEDRPRVGCRLHGRDEAGRLDATDGDPPYAAPGGGGHPARRRQPVLGPGERVGQALADLPLVDLISLTGGIEAGRA